MASAATSSCTCCRPAGSTSIPSPSTSSKTAWRAPLQPDNALYEFGALVGQPKADTPPIGFSGLRINSPINRPNVFDEVLVFQGASYFRGVSRGQAYGLSARGLAIDVAQPSGEEFPFFRTFWVERPARSSRQLVVHALLDSPGATGAYTFRIAGGAPTTVDVDVKLFPRRDLMHVGVAPLTSMFLFGGNNRSRMSDFRRAVHDSDGLAIATQGEQLWRPLANPRRLQVSAFSVQDLKGFGLIQRHRSFSDYEDLEANYERRPSAWIEPVGSWGNGTVRLVEIPSEEEIHDNIVAYWNPLEPYAQGPGLRLRLPRLLAERCAAIDGYLSCATRSRGRRSAPSARPAASATRSTSSEPTSPIPSCRRRC